jgi:hypothetical protein
MVKDMTPREERRGTGAMFLWTSVVVIAIGVGLVVWFFVPGFNHSNTPNLAANGPRSNQTQGMSVTAQQTQPLPLTTPRSDDPATVGRKESLTASATPDLNLSPDQINAIKSYVAQHSDQRVGSVSFTMTVGAAVPTSAPLHPIPPQLGRSLSSFKDDQYILVGNQFLIVEKDTRRIVAIVPVPA